MNIVIISHERSLNKAEGLIRAHANDNVFVITEIVPDLIKKPYMQQVKVVHVKNFVLTEIVKRITQCDKIYCVSENLLPLQSQLESYFGIQNLNPFAAEILSNKQLFDNFCRDIGLGDYVPQSITPTFHKQLDAFKNKELFSKPDIGTGSNIFWPGDNHNSPSVEYRRWNNKYHFLQYIKDKNIHNEFFDVNKQGIHIDRFNNKPCRIMFQEYIWSEEPSICPYGYIKDGKVYIDFYVKNSKIKYGEVLNPDSDPIQSHSVSKISDIVRERAVWIVMKNEVSHDISALSQYFLQRLVDELKIKDLFFVGPDFHISGNRVVGIDFNPRPGQFINILDRLNPGNVIENFVKGKTIDIKNKLLWGCAVLKPGVIKDVKDMSHLQEYFNTQNVEIVPGMEIPEFQSLQNKSFNVNLDITGNDEQELFNNYIKVNQLLQECIIY
jgi:hypothetical protein